MLHHRFILQRHEQYTLQVILQASRDWPPLAQIEEDVASVDLFVRHNALEVLRLLAVTPAEELYL